jgi:hypothetical protein
MREATVRGREGNDSGGVAVVAKRRGRARQWFGASDDGVVEVRV